MADQDDGYITTTTADVLLGEKWVPKILDVVYGAMVMKPLVTYFEAPVGVEKLHIPGMKKLVAEAITDGTPLVGAQNTETEVTLSLNLHKGVPFTITKRTLRQNFLGEQLLEQYTRRAGEAIAYAIDQSLLGLYSGLSQTVNCYSTGTTAGHITDAYLRTAINYLDEAGAPLNDRHFVICPMEKKTLLGIDKFSLASNFGSTEPIQNGLFGEIYGVKVWVSPYVATATTRQNLLFHKEAFGLAIQQGIDFNKSYEPLKVAWDVVVDALYGVVELRDTFAVNVITKAAA